MDAGLTPDNHKHVVSDKKSRTDDIQIQAVAAASNRKLFAYVGLLFVLILALSIAYSLGAPPAFLIIGTFVAVVLIILFVLLEVLLHAVGRDSPSIRRAAEVAIFRLLHLCFLFLIVSAVMFFIWIWINMPGPGADPPARFTTTPIHFPTVVPATLKYLVKPPQPNNLSEVDRYRLCMDQLWSWAVKGAAQADEKRQVLFAESAPETFDLPAGSNATHFSDFYGHVQVGGVTIEDGIAILMHEEDGINFAKVRAYRQLPFKVVPQEQNGQYVTTSNECHVVGAKPGDKLWLFLRVLGTESLKNTHTYTVSFDLVQ